MEMAWQKRKRRGEERAGEALQTDQETAKEALQIAEKALQTVNESGSTVRNFYITFLLLGIYIGIIIANTTDRQLLLISPVTLPLLNVQLPILGFYIFVPWLFLLAHFNLLLQLFLMSDKLRVFVRASAALPDGEAESLHKQLIDFPAVQMLANLQYDRLIQWLLALVVWITVLFLPLGLLLWAQLRFLPYHNADITWGHRAAVLLDALMLLLFWPRLVSGQGAWGWWITCLAQQGQNRVKRGAGRALGAVILVTLMLSLLVATVPEEPWEVWLLAHLPANWVYEPDPPQRQFFYLTYLLFEDQEVLSRNLDLREQLLTVNELSADVQHALRKGTEQQQEQARQKVQGLNLRGRDLRHADLGDSLLPEADLRGAQMQEAYLAGARLQGADLRWAQLAGAVLARAQLAGADLSGAELAGAVLIEAQLAGAVLFNAQLVGAVLRGAQLAGAVLARAQLAGADLRGAQLTGAVLIEAQLAGANLIRAQLAGANLRWAQLVGADLRWAQLAGAVLIKAQLVGADLRGAQLTGADLREAQLAGADLRNAHLQGADLRQALDFWAAVSRGKYEIFQDALERSISNPKIRKTILEKLEKIIDQPVKLDDLASATQCLSDRPKLLPGCLTESKMAKYLETRADYLVNQVACSEVAAAQGLLRRAMGADQTVEPMLRSSAARAEDPLIQALTRSAMGADQNEDSPLANALLKANCEPVKTARSKLSDEDKKALERLAGESQ